MPVWFWSMKDADKKLIAGDDWVPYLGGDHPGFPVESLQRLRADSSVADARQREDECS